MAWNKTNGFAMLLIGCGVLILLNKIGFGLGGLFSIIFPIAVIALGYLGLKNGRSIIGSILMFFGIIMLLGKLSGLIGWIVAIALIAYGIHTLKGRKVY